MKVFELNTNRQIIGRAGERGGITLTVNIRRWLEAWPDGLGALMCQRPDGRLFPVAVTVSGEIMSAELPEECLQMPGVYSYTPTWTENETVRVGRKYECVLMAAYEPPKPCRHGPDKPHWATEVLTSAEGIKRDAETIIANISTAAANAEISTRAKEAAIAAKAGAEEAQAAAGQSASTAAAAEENAAQSAEEAAETAERFDYIAKHIGIRKISATASGIIELPDVTSADQLDELKITGRSFADSTLALMYVRGKAASGADTWERLCRLPDMGTFLWWVYWEDPEAGTFESASGNMFKEIVIDLLNKTVRAEWGYKANYQQDFPLPGRWESDKEEYVPGTLPSKGANISFELANPVTATLDFDELPIVDGIGIKYGMLNQYTFQPKNWNWAATYAVDEYKQELDLLGLSVVDGKLCTTYEEG